jgi:hypothetical protein
MLDMELEVIEIPFPRLLLKGEWEGTVYSICTTHASLDEHNKAVEETIRNIVEEYDKKHHWSVSLRFVKKELAVSFDVTETYLTLVQFRVRDSY